ncbi:sulfatase-like hydrolase/transferase [Streptomyces puniciscabiei]|uniref:sulfatase-like hydrolase/transferase n=1 Tax=Streptomyces puniciscabiei TaxID=164348 RepID=UPI001F24850C|nr:sulfatase-like hydrolase/transferase [Streptomyces puniciscabiei]
MPDCKRILETDDQVAHARYEYAALLSMCDHSLGRVLDAMDEHGLWDDTLLIVDTDHGFLLGEKGWWGKTVQVWYDELVHLPLFVWDPRVPEAAGQRRRALVQTIDLAPTILDFFGVEPAADTQRLPLPVADDTPVREAALFGIHGGHVNVTDGRYVYMRAPVSADNTPLEEHTLIPTHMRRAGSARPSWRIWSWPGRSASPRACGRCACRDAASSTPTTTARCCSTWSTTPSSSARSSTTRPSCAWRGCSWTCSAAPRPRPASTSGSACPPRAPSPHSTSENRSSAPAPRPNNPAEPQVTAPFGQAQE